MAARHVLSASVMLGCTSVTQWRSQEGLVVPSRAAKTQLRR